MNNKKIFTTIIALTLMAIMTMSGCAPTKTEPEEKATHIYEKSNVETDLIFTSKSNTGVSVSMPQNVQSDKQVGIFYFIWQGTEGEYEHIYDNTKILSNIEIGYKTIIKLSEWMEAGGGSTGKFHWWGESAFGYYDMADEWVITRHMQSLADADIDYILIDETNGVIEGYLPRIKLVCKVLYKLQQQGVDVPRVAFMCYDDGPSTLNTLYVKIYKANPEWESIFYHWNNNDKPVIFDNIDGFSRDASYMINKEEKLASYKEEACEYFEIRDVAFPHETRNEKSGIDNGLSITYLDFRANPEPYIDCETGYSFMSVSVAEICESNNSSKQWFTNTNDRTRSWDGEANRNWTEPDAYLYGYNIARQYANALNYNVDNVFITGWNEWIAQNQAQNDYSGVRFVDNADINNSRDIEPMNGGYEDNYYLQMCDFVRKFKYGTITEQTSLSKTIDLIGSFDQWNDVGILTYQDAKDETFARDSHAANVSTLKYTADAALNDIQTLKITSDSENYYFYVQTLSEISTASNGGMMLVITNEDFTDTVTVNKDGDMAIARLIEDGATKLATAGVTMSGNEMMVSVSRDIFEGSTINFKWVEGGDAWKPMSWYTCPEAAPYGRMFVKYCA